jgi:DNA-binding response OmpR family regulator
MRRRSGQDRWRFVVASSEPDYIQKPFTASHLIRKVRAALSGSTARR